ncbi:SRPBCC family protein [Nakamurella antarctica]|uniref:SRPBCC family protein n=1 Tax=Nakamurella antarctica TaxID=1902245 RepID=UPI001EF0CAE3|nr:SRPBCC family protein [Nakamurella antarctica]
MVGASRIRDVDQNWPATGASIHHSVGSWPLLTDDTTTVLDCSTNSRLVLSAKAWPAGEAKVELAIAPHLKGCTVTISEDAVSGPALLIPKPLRQAILRARNNEALQRLQYLAENRERPKTANE